MEQALLVQAPGNITAVCADSCLVLRLILFCRLGVSSAVHQPSVEAHSIECAGRSRVLGGAWDGLHLDEERAGAADRRLKQRRQRSGAQTAPQRPGGLEVRQRGAVSRSGSEGFILLVELQMLKFDPFGKV